MSSDDDFFFFSYIQVFRKMIFTSDSATLSFLSSIFSSHSGGLSISV